MNPLLSFQRFESDMKKSMSEFQSELERLQKARQEGLFNYTDNEGLEKKWNYLKTRWNTLWKEHLENRNRWELSDHLFEIDLSNTVTVTVVVIVLAYWRWRAFRCNLCDTGSYVGYKRGHLYARVDGHKITSSSVRKHYDNDHAGAVPENLLSSVLKKCMNKFDCLVNEMLYIKQLTPSLNVQTDSIRAKVFM